jgi:tRNA-specific 2-thiouridylase
LERAEAEGADFIATGHYAKIQNGKLSIPKDLTKDQTYFLYRMPKAALFKVIFPLGDLQKTEVKQLAKKMGFRTAMKKESMGMCFVGDIEMSEFLGEFIEATPGEIIDEVSSEVVGKHKGVAFYTLGQRHGLYLGGGAPYYVAGKDVEQNILYVSRAAGIVEVAELELVDCHWLTVGVAIQELRARTRHLGELLVAELDGEAREGGEAKIRLAKKTRLVASGQSVVLYDENDVCLGGGFVK